MNMLNTMDGWMDGWVDGWVDGWMDGWMDGQMDKIIFDPKYFKLLCDEIDALTWSASPNILQKLF